MEPIIGIDLGTTNSEVAFVRGSHCEVITDNDGGIVPSCVGLDDHGRVLVGQVARNQALIAPDRTVLSAKRHMGSDQRLRLGTDSYSPQEISAFILKSLKQRATAQLGREVHKAVITVPAYFTDAQRQATREAGQIAGLEVVRIINEPTAAALAYESTNPEAQRILVYDLGGGTFDVSIVSIEAGVVEVLASTGDSRLGGDDFDQRIIDLLVEELKARHHLAALDNPALMARLKRAAENAKIQLSAAPFARIEEDHVGRQGGREIHLSLEISRHRLQEMIEPFLEKTMEAVNRALKDASMLPSAIDKIILVGGSTRIPRIAEMLEEKFGRLPHSEIDPDLCVAVGAGLQAGREMGIQDSGVLVDITPYTFGTSAVGELDGAPCMTRFVPLIRRNTKLPARRSEVFFTMVDNQEAVDVQVFQGEAPDALDNVQLGNYLFKLTPAPAGSEIVMHFDLDLNGILKIRAAEKKTGKEISAVIENAMSRYSTDELAHTQERINGLWSGGQDSSATPEKAENDSQADEDLPPAYAEVVQRAHAKLAAAPDEDRDEMVNLIEAIHDALDAGRPADADAARDELDDILFYLE